MSFGVQNKVYHETVADSEDDHSSSTGHRNSSGDEPSTYDARAARLVGRSKLLMYTMGVLAIASSIYALVYLINEQKRTMELEFTSYSRESLNKAQANAIGIFEELWDVSNSITSHALATNASWPNVTLPHLDRHVFRDHYEQRSNLEFAAFAPYITPETRGGWTAYSQANLDWIAEDCKYRGWSDDEYLSMQGVPTEIHRFNESAPIIHFNESDYQYEIPLWQLAPPPKEDKSMIMLDLATVPILAHLLRDIKVKKVEQFGRVMDLGFIMGDVPDSDHPRGTVFQPVFEDFLEDAEVVGFLFGSLPWDNIFKGIDSPAPILLEIEGTCTTRFTYRINGDKKEFLGYGDGIRDQTFDEYKRSGPLLTPLNSRPGYPPVIHTHRSTDASHPESHCEYLMNAYPTEAFVSSFQAAEAVYITVAALAIVILAAVVFVLYDCLVARRQERLERTATKTTAIVSSLFPKEVRERMMNDIESGGAKSRESTVRTGKTDLMSLQPKDLEDGELIRGAPIADFFQEATVMFADIVGFTAWSNSREPTAVFHLLETLYGAFDQIARRRGVFKVETIGDCYVAVCGLPKPNKDHAMVMLRFAKECLLKMQSRLVDLEAELGPDTSTLGMRIGLHTGSITAGVLRGDKARFQLFGDTVNTCSRIESAGQKNRVHLSERTAEKIIELGKAHWLEERLDVVELKGLGTVRTYWLKGVDATGTSGRSSTDGDDDSRNIVHVSALSPTSLLPEDTTSASEKQQRIVDYVSEMMCVFLKKIQATREEGRPQRNSKLRQTVSQMVYDEERRSIQDGGIGIDEVVDAIKFQEPEKPRVNHGFSDALDMNVVNAELKAFVASVADLYGPNPFHSFDHAVHVTQSVAMLLSRIAKHDTCRITSEPLVLFAITLSALVHDLDHSGVPNFILAQEQPQIGEKYKGRAIAEQHSIDVAWELLMSDQFSSLRKAIYGNVEEFHLFRQILVNCLLATDIFDKELSQLRKDRWERAFGPNGGEVAKNCKATILVENIIQAADVSHMMQHWDVYMKWNTRLYHEMYMAYVSGRSSSNPTETWFQGELSFFDNYIIPLAMKLKESNLFGAQSNEFLNYANANRRRWEMEGRQVVEANYRTFSEMVQTTEGESTETK